MNGPEHYREAENCITRSTQQDPEWAAQTLATAQIHATLALAAATLAPSVAVYIGGNDEIRGWVEAVR